MKGIGAVWYLPKTQRTICAAELLATALLFQPGGNTELSAPPGHDEDTCDHYCASPHQQKGRRPLQGGAISPFPPRRVKQGTSTVTTGLHLQPRRDGAKGHAHATEWVLGFRSRARPTVSDAVWASSNGLYLTDAETPSSSSSPWTAADGTNTHRKFLFKNVWPILYKQVFSTQILHFSIQFHTHVYGLI